MSRKFKFISVFRTILTLIVLQGCTSLIKEMTTAEEPAPLTASELTDKMAEAVDPEGKLNSFNTLQCKALYTKFNKKDKIRTEYKYELWEIDEPEIVYFQEDETISAGYKKSETIFKVLINNRETTVTVIKDGELLNSDHIEKSTINKYKEMALSFKDRLFFGLYKDTVSKEISEKIYSIKGSQCYRISLVLRNRFFDDNSDNITIYTDCNTFLIRKIEGEHSKIFNIEYKNIDGVVLPWKYQITSDYLFGDNKDVFFVELNQFELNKKVDTSKYMEQGYRKHNI
jgi:hypothetical protein